MANGVSERGGEAMSRNRAGRSLHFGRGTWVALMSAVGVVACGGGGQSSDGPHVPEVRLAPAELETAPEDQSQIGSAKATGIQTRIVVGTPNEKGFYSIMLFVPPETTIQAHSHRDDRVASVLSGTWQFAYGEHFDASQLKELAPGSVYSEPGGESHFARTGSEPVVLHITGNGPTDTHYINPADDPKTKQ
jgi:quercetin dioxygenase-like cupin family protein